MTVTSPRGFRAAGATAGLKASGRPDLALVVNDGPAHYAAGVFTGNRVQAAPVVWSRRVVADGRVDAVVLNSGGANACTGPTGFQNTHATAERVATTLGVSAADVRAVLTTAYGSEPFVHLLTPGAWPHTSSTYGSNSAHLQAAVDIDSGRVLVTSAIDNLGKGAAGQALQCANLALGLEETAGLSVAGVAP